MTTEPLNKRLLGDYRTLEDEEKELPYGAAVTQIVTVPRVGVLEGGEKKKIDEDEEAIEVGVVSITGYKVAPGRNFLFWLVFFVILGLLGYISWLWPGGVFSYDAACESILGVPTGGCLSYQIGYFFAVFIIFGGLEVLWFKWYPGHYVRLRSKKIPLNQASVVVIETTDGTFNPVDVKTEIDLSGKQQRVFEFRHCKFAWDTETMKYWVVQSDMGAPRLKEPQGGPLGMKEELVKRKIQWDGPNLIDVPLPSIPHLLASEILHPFLWFQFFSIIVWCMEDYYIYSMLILAMTVAIAVISLIETRGTIITIREMSRFIADVTVIREGQQKVVSSDNIVAGDIVVITSKTILPFDAILLHGEAIVNESMLTGESVPVVKVSYDSRSTNPNDVPKACVLYNGTYCIQAKCTPTDEYRVPLAKVWKTGFSTTKGRLVRSILFPRPSKFSLYEDGFKFIGVMALLALLGFLISIYYYLRDGVRPAQIVLYGLDMVTTVVPPALPTTLLTGMSLALTRLKDKKIFCVSPPRVNVAGKVGLMCFDKTGTLTEDGLDLQCIVPVRKGKFLEKRVANAVKNINRTGGEGDENLLKVCAACHGLRYIHDTAHGKPELVGDPLEVKLFSATEWQMKESHHNPEGIAEEDKKKIEEKYAFAATPPHGSVDGLHELRLVKAYEFSSALQRMAVITRDMVDESLTVFVKGSPEAISSLSDPATIPEDLDMVLKQYVKAGYRVLACASRNIESTTDYQNLSQQDAEGKQKLVFHGLIVMENKLKEQSRPTLEILHQADIGIVMITGDHALTAIHVARKLGIIPDNGCKVFIADSDEHAEKIMWKNEATDHRLTEEEQREAGLLPSGHLLAPLDVHNMHESVRNKSDISLVITGRAFEALCKQSALKRANEQHLRYLLESVVVAARFSPVQKQKLVDLFAEVGHVTGFCGDGANDCGALKSADVGLSLSPDAEASVAAPFTSKITNVSSVITLLQEGRCALCTSFLLFKFMALYALIEGSYNLQTYIISTYLGDWVYFLDDLILVLPLAAFLGNTEPYEGLDKKRPLTALMSVPVLASIFGQIFLCIVFQLFARKLVRDQSFFLPQAYQATDDMTDDDIYYLPGFEPTCVFVTANFQFIWMAIVFTISKPFRKEFWTNIPYTIDLIFAFALCMAILYADNVTWICDTLKMIEIPDYNFRNRLFGLIMANLVVCWMYEQLILFIISKNKKWQK